uniref:Uncharacterized protein n=2 Tax=Entomoneis paludosa TaxID=265537 RepID=A0A7S2Y9K3_9STRA|mmetsp:Transcript_23837/g.49525  ORF Transcript_23837/g.49525 Transcript_23837/m.49525 type:complete len:137 (+) Transcript_23837:467-877(+)
MAQETSTRGSDFFTRASFIIAQAMFSTTRLIMRAVQHFHLVSLINSKNDVDEERAEEEDPPRGMDNARLITSLGRGDLIFCCFDSGRWCRQDGISPIVHVLSNLTKLLESLATVRGGSSPIAVLTKHMRIQVMVHC